MGSLIKEPVEGDVNADGAFNVADAVMLQKWLFAIPDATLVDWKAADMCEDNRIDVFDLCLLKRKLLKHI
ncbi:MAG: dockerin type I repeat-containing protein [Ruminococcus sp.]|nr:dockerin type I repeat-containing protein [Ruminococcus sp.]